MAGWVDELPPCYLYGHKGQSVGFLALTGEGDRRFVHLAAVLERREEIAETLGRHYEGVLLDLEVRNGA